MAYYLFDSLKGKIERNAGGRYDGAAVCEGDGFRITATESLVKIEQGILTYTMDSEGNCKAEAAGNVWRIPGPEIEQRLSDLLPQAFRLAVAGEDVGLA